MKKLLFTLFIFITFLSHAQQVETITIPKGVVYNYCSVKTLEKAKKILSNNLSADNDYKLVQEHLIVGPILWERYKDNENIKKIPNGKVQFHVDNLVLDGKMTQDINDTKIIWDEFRKEVAQDYKIRKATENELNYYWSVISFDIEEPLLIVETKEHNYILNILEKDLKLLWLDEAPKKNNTLTANYSGVKKYQNGEEIDSIPKGEKETSIEKVMLLSTDDVIIANSSVEDITDILNKTNKIFDELFKGSEKSGRIRIQFELKG